MVALAMTKRRTPKRTSPRPRDLTDPADQLRHHIALRAAADEVSRLLQFREAAYACADTGSCKRLLVDLRIAELADDQETATQLWLRERPTFIAILTAAYRPYDIDWLMDLLPLVLLRFLWSFVFDRPLPPMLFQLSTLLAERRQRLPKAGGVAIRRGVAWFVRSELKHPADSIAELAAEYVRHQKAAGVHVAHARTTVVDGIVKAKVVLGVRQSRWTQN